MAATRQQPPGRVKVTATCSTEDRSSPATRQTSQPTTSPWYPTNHLLNLPGELRNHIFELVFGAGTIDLLTQLRRQPVLYACRQMRDEGVPIYKKSFATSYFTIHVREGDRKNTHIEAPIRLASLATWSIASIISHLTLINSASTYRYEYRNGIWTMINDDKDSLFKNFSPELYLPPNKENAISRAGFFVGAMPIGPYRLASAHVDGKTKEQIAVAKDIRG